MQSLCKLFLRKLYYSQKGISTIIDLIGVWDYTPIKSMDCHGKSCIQQEEDSFYQQIGLKFEEEANKMLHLEHGFVWC